MTNIFFAHSDPKTIQLYKPILSAHFTLDSAHDGLAAVRRIRLHKPSLIISDYQLPTLSGLSLLKYVRSNKNLRASPFLFFTNHDDPTEALGLGASDWISAATTPDVLLNKIYYHLKYV